MAKQRQYYKTRHPRVLGHRGSAGTYPENTLVSFRQGLFGGADVLEMDVHLTKDGYIVVCHDDTVDRTTNGTGRIADMTIGEIRRLDAGYRFTLDGGKTFPFRGKGIRIPVFEEVLEAYPFTPINVELKVDNDELVHKFMKLLERKGRLHDGSIMVVATAHELTKKIRQLMPERCSNGYSKREITLAVIASRLHLPWLMPRTAAAFQVPVRQGGIEIVTPAFVKFAHQIGAEVHVWTIDDEAEMARLLDMGVDALFTDLPGRMTALLQRRGQRS